MAESAGDGAEMKTMMQVMAGNIARVTMPLAEISLDRRSAMAE
jgi:hypothetical protein